MEVAVAAPSEPQPAPVPVIHGLATSTGRGADEVSSYDNAYAKPEAREPAALTQDVQRNVQARTRCYFGGKRTPSCSPTVGLHALCSGAHNMPFHHASSGSLDL